MRNFIFILLFLSAVSPAFSHTVPQPDDRKVAENGIIDAVSLYNQGKFGESAAILRRLLLSSPENDAAHFYLGLNEFCMDNVAESEKELKKAAELDSSNFWYRYRLAMVYSAAGKQELTLAIFEDLIRDFPKKYDLYYSLIEIYQSQGQSDKALETLDQIELVFGKTELTVMARFDLLRKLGKEEEAYACLEDFNRENSSVQVLSLLGDRQLSMYNDSLAVAYYDEALSLDSSYAPAMLGKAEAFRLARNYDSFFKIVDDFIRNDNFPVSGKCGYLNALVRSSDQMFLRNFRKKLDSVVTACSDRYPGDSTVTFTAGMYYYSTGRTEQAAALFKENVENWPSSLTAAATYVEMLMYMKDWDNLVSESEKAFSRFPSETAFLEYESIGEFNRGNYGKVVDICGKIIDIAAGDSARMLNAYSTMGDMYFTMGEKPKAFRAYDKALEINPGYLPVLNNYAYYLSQERKKLKKAYAMSKKTIEAEPDNSTYLDTFGWILYLQGKPLEAKPFLKNAVMLYGGKESPVVLDHYAEILFSLKEYDLAFLYWGQAVSKNSGQIEGLEEKVRERKHQMKKEN